MNFLAEQVTTLWKSASNYLKHIDYVTTFNRAALKNLLYARCKWKTTPLNRRGRSYTIPMIYFAHWFSVQILKDWDIIC
jgi:hypothetical protein